MVAGAAGVGKTRLLREALGAAERRVAAGAWVTATRAAASIPFGAVAHLLAPVPGDGEGRLTLLRSAAYALAERAGGRPYVLAVDDAHLLDEASATLVHQLAGGGIASVLLALRAGEPAPDAITALWAQWTLEPEPGPSFDGITGTTTAFRPGGGLTDKQLKRGLDLAERVLRDLARPAPRPSPATP